MSSFSRLPSLTHLSLLATVFFTVFSLQTSIKASYIDPFKCSANINTCNASLYHINRGLDMVVIASLYSVNSSQIQKLPRGAGQDYLITVPCSCKIVTDIRGYFFDTTHIVDQNDTYMNISEFYYSGQAWSPTDNLTTGENLTIHLPCGCTESDSQIVVTYTVQHGDTLAQIADLLSSTLTDIQNMNEIVANESSFIQEGWVLYVPKDLNGIPSSKGSGKKLKHFIIIGVLVGVVLLSVIIIIILVVWRKRSTETRKEDSQDTKAVSKRSTSKVLSKRSISNRSILSLKNPQLHIETIEEVTSIDSERPVTFYLEEIEEAINKESKIIGKGGYGTVYFGILGEKEVAIKEMRSNKSKEFYAELKVLCRIHHINIVELLGYASGEDNLYLVYEYVSKGSLSDHLHNPFLKGHEPLSWTARAQIALDAAKGLEYIHDYTKARHVHRDIKTSNILLDNKLRAKIADFGLVKLLERTNDDEFIATRLVGTPGYLPPESVKELQVTSKTDVFAFGVVLAELVTGRPALFRDCCEETPRTRSLISVINKVFEDEDPESALEEIIDKNLRDSYPVEDVFKMTEIAERCLREEPIERPEMREIVVILSQILMSSTEWEASLGGDSEVFSGIFTGR